VCRAPGTIFPAPRARLVDGSEVSNDFPDTVDAADCMAVHDVPEPTSIVNNCGVPDGSTTTVAPSLKDWADEKVRAFDPAVVLTVPDPETRLLSVCEFAMVLVAPYDRGSPAAMMSASV